MYYYQISLRQVKDLYTWESEFELSPGARVVVPFRNRDRIGFVVEVVDEPDFKTASIKQILDEPFIPPASLTVASLTAARHFTPLSKVLALMIPEPYWLKIQPEKYQTQWQLSPGFESSVLKHPTAKALFTWINLQGGAFWQDTLPPEFKNSFRTFVKNEILYATQEALVPEFSLSVNREAKPNHALTPAQTEALDALLKINRGSLLWGVTGSGKTEVYKHYFSHKLEASPTAQGLFLLPEIALTPQLINDFKQAFGDQIAVWHSHLTVNEKVQAWKRLQTGSARILIGTRSAALVPIPNLTAIIVDEEHEWTFKNEFNPRFWAHEVVEDLAHTLDIPYIYASATPKLRTYTQAQQGDLALVCLSERVHKTALPTIELVDLTQESKRGNFEPISARLQAAITEVITTGKQVVLFLNKRGYAGSAMCRFCGDPFHCDHCDMPLKYHRQGQTQRLICHVCGFMKAFPKNCPHCEQTEFQFRGWGTQQLEAQLRTLFPETKIFRADRDNITGRYDFENLLNDFKQTPGSILLGTQMIAKGLDFESVALVGVVLADVGLHLPDHHAEERVYQLLEQVSGRAGRRHIQGHIIVQTYQSELPLFSYLQHHDTAGFMQQKLHEHQALKLPPFSQIAKIIVVDRDKGQAFAQCKALHLSLEAKLKAASLQDTISVSWAPAFFPKLHNKYWFYVFLKSDDSAALSAFMQAYDWPESVKIDVSPASLI